MDVVQILERRVKWVLLSAFLLAAAALSVLGRRANPTPSSSVTSDGAVVSTFPRLDGYPFAVRYSAGAGAQAVRLADLTRDAYVYFDRVFPGVGPSLTAAFLSPTDWKQGYGMPSYYPPERRLRVASDDNPFWRRFGTIARVASPWGAYPKLRRTYANTHGDLDLRRFFDLLAVHELAHAFEVQGGAAFPTHWLREIFADLALHAFVAETRPGQLADLTTFPEAERGIAVFNLVTRLSGYTSLDEFDRHYPAGNPREPMSGPNYGWYQIRFHVLAREMFEEGGTTALSRLWEFGRSEAGRTQAASDYFRDHGTLAGWSDRTHAKDLASRLGAEVSPRLGRAVADWR